MTPYELRLLDKYIDLKIQQTMTDSFDFSTMDKRDLEKIKELLLDEEAERPKANLT